MIVEWFKNSADVNIVAAHMIVKTDSVLDIGTGIKPQSFFHPKVHVCVDAHQPYLDLLQQQIEDNSSYVLLCNTWRPALKQFPANSIDSVFALDFIEHLPKAEGIDLLKEMKRIARRQVIIFTPLGFYPQNHDNQTEDRWGMDGGKWQTHHSGWEAEDFDDEWYLMCCKQYHLVDEHNQLLDEPFGAIWAILDLQEQPSWRISLARVAVRWNTFSQRIKRYVPTAIKNVLRPIVKKIR
jgi:predicted SAM-dependent methyltransferase